MVVGRVVVVMVGRHFDNRGGCGSVREWKGNTEDEELIMCVDCLFICVCVCVRACTCAISRAYTCVSAYF